MSESPKRDEDVHLSKNTVSELSAQPQDKDKLTASQRSINSLGKINIVGGVSAAAVSGKQRER